MHLQKLIKISFSCWLVLFATCVSAQKDTIEYIKSPYRAEYTPYFKLGVFKRGFSNDSLKMALDSLENKPRTTWSRSDSLTFAQISLETGNKALSQYYFDQLEVDIHDEEDFWYDALMIHYLNGNYDRGLQMIHDDSPMVIEFSRLYFFRKVLQAKKNQAADDKWYKTNMVLDWSVDTTLNELPKDGPEFKEAVIDPLRNLEYVLKKIISYVHEDDPIIASSCKEMGRIIDGHLSLSQAYIAFSLGRHYNHKDKELLSDVREVKAQMTQNKYKIPNFRKYFPRIEYWRFDYNMLKEQIITAKNDTNIYVQPNTMKPKKEPLITFPHELIVIGGLFLFILLIVILLKTRKR